MVSTRKKRWSNRNLFSQLDDIDQDIVIGNSASDRQDNTIVNEGTGDQEFIVGISDNNLMANENIVNVKTFERCFIERIDREMSKIGDTVEGRIQMALSTAIYSIVAPKVEITNKSKNASSGWGATSVTAN